MQDIEQPDWRERFPLSELKELSTFGALPEDMIEWLLDRGRIIDVADGESLFQPDERGDSFFIVLDGCVSHHKHHHGDFAHTRDYHRGEQVGFVSMVALHPRVGRAGAVGPGTVLEVDCNLFQRMHEEHPNAFGILLLNVAREMARTIRTLGNTMVNITSRGDPTS